MEDWLLEKAITMVSLAQNEDIGRVVALLDFEDQLLRKL